MSDGAVRFAARYPRVWHVIEADGAGPWLMCTGLFPAAQLHRVAGLLSDGTNREDFQLIDLGDARKAVLRPQLMQDHRLMPALAGGYAGRRDESTLGPVADYRSGPVAELAIRGHTGLSGVTICEA